MNLVFAVAVRNTRSVAENRAVRSSQAGILSTNYELNHDQLNIFSH